MVFRVRQQRQHSPGRDLRFSFLCVDCCLSGPNYNATGYLPDRSVSVFIYCQPGEYDTALEQLFKLLRHDVALKIAHHHEDVGVHLVYLCVDGCKFVRQQLSDFSPFSVPKHFKFLRSTTFMIRSFNHYPAGGLVIYH